MRAAAVIPTFEEGTLLGPVVRKAVGFVERVFVVDDGSRCAVDTPRSHPSITVLRHEVNRGKGVALKTGMKAALSHGYDVIVTLDGDGQHDPADIPRFLNAARRADLVIGQRVREAPMPGIRRLSNGFSAVLLSLLHRRPWGDVHCGFRAYGAEFLRAQEIRSRRFEVEVELFVKAMRDRRRVIQVPVSTKYGHEQSKISPALDMMRFLRAVGVFTLGLDRWISKPRDYPWWSVNSPAEESGTNGYWTPSVASPATSSLARK